MESEAQYVKQDCGLKPACLASPTPNPHSPKQAQGFMQPSAFCFPEKLQDMQRVYGP